MQKTLLQIIHETSLQSPESLCVIDSLGEHTYKEIWNKIEGYISGLKKIRGTEKGTKILVECTQDSEFIALIFACNYLGVIFVPIEHKASIDRIRQIYQDTDALLYVCKNTFSDDVISNMAFQEVFDSCSEGKLGDVKYPDLNDISEILYTTGTTGAAKGIIISNLNNVALAENIAFGTEMKPANREFIPLPLSHSHGLRACYANLYRSGCVFLTEGISNIAAIYETIKKYSITAMDLSPTAMLFLLKITKGKFSEFNSQFDYIQVGTAMLTEDLKKMMKQTFPDVRLYNFYGSTEAGRCCVLNFNSKMDKPFCIGKPTKHSSFIITDEAHNVIESSADNTGLLACAGKMNMLGYLNQPELTASVLQNGYVFSNDEAYIDEDGLIFVIGRRGDVINYKGIKIAPTEIENIVVRHSLIKECACVPLKDERAGQVPVLFIVVEDAEKFNRQEFYSFLNENIDKNKVPKEVLIIDSIPRTYNGKIKRNELEKKLYEQIK